MKGALGTLKRASKESLKRALRRAVRGLSPGGSGISPEYFELDRDGAGRVTWSGVALGELPAEWGSPLHVVSAERLRRNVKRFLTTAPGLPGCEVFYSYKTNPVPGVLRELHALGVGAEVISHYELWLALELGVPPERIVYNGPAKSPESIRLAIERQIGLININHREELPVVAELAGRLGRRPQIGLRVNMGGWAGQFGTPVSGDRALAAFAEALAHPTLEVTGLHVHRGGMIQTAADAAGFVQDVLTFTDVVHRKFGLNFAILDLGGSLCSPSVRGLSGDELRLNRTLLRELRAPDPAGALQAEDYVKLVSEQVSAHFRGAGRERPRVFLEPGRAISSDAQLLLTRVVGLKDEGDTTFAILDAGINVAESCRGEYHEILPLDSAGTAARTYTLVGPICTPADTLRWAVRLPELAVGDTLAVMDAGAYFVPFSTAFSFPRPGIVMVDRGHVTSLRRAETFEDLVGLDAALVTSQ